MKKLIRTLLCVLLITALIFAGLIFWPRSYPVRHLQKRAGTQYWELQTGSHIAYNFIEGKGKKYPYPLIYLHGGPGAGITDREIETYTKLAENGFDVYLYDQVGCGHSNRLENIRDYTPIRHEKDLEEIIRKINASKVVLVGQSWGSILAIMYLADHPAQIEKLVITAPAPIQPARGELAQIPPPDSLHLRQPLFSNKMANEKTANRRSEAMYWAGRKYGKKLMGDEEADEFAAYLTTELNRSMVCDTGMAVISEGTEGMYVHFMTVLGLGKVKDPRETLKSLETPVLIMKAQCDNQPWGFTTEYLDLFRHREFDVVKNAGHNIFLEKPAEYVRLISDFLLK